MTCLIPKEIVVPLPFLPYGEDDEPVSREHWAPRGARLQQARRNSNSSTSEKTLLQRKKFAQFRQRYRAAISKAVKETRSSMEEKILETRTRVKQFIALTAVDNSIARERTREYLFESSQKVRKIIDLTRTRVRAQALENMPEEQLKAQIVAARDHVNERAIGLELAATVSAYNLSRQWARVKAHHESIKSEANELITKYKDDFYKVPRQDLAQGERTKINLDKKQGAEESKEEEKTQGRRFFLERELEKGQGEKISRLRREITIARSNFKERVEGAEIELISRGAETMKEGQSRLILMQKNMNQAKLLFGLDVKFARHNLIESAKTLRYLEIQSVARFTDKRRKEQERARAYRKVAAIRNALVLIHSVR
ncbi:MAG: hypothetical protein ACREBS_00105 [Nitrososphaerales archaeon]